MVIRKLLLFNCVLSFCHLPLLKNALKKQRLKLNIIFIVGVVLQNMFTDLTTSKAPGASLVAQWLRGCLLMQGTRVPPLVWEDPACRGVAGPVSHKCWACVSGACAPRGGAAMVGGPRWWEARAPRWGVAPACRDWRKPSHRSEDPTQTNK